MKKKKRLISISLSLSLSLSLSYTHKKQNRTKHKKYVWYMCLKTENCYLKTFVKIRVGEKVCENA